jgi:hypothetical protein
VLDSKDTNLNLEVVGVQRPRVEMVLSERNLLQPKNDFDSPQVAQEPKLAGQQSQPFLPK